MKLLHFRCGGRPALLATSLAALLALAGAGACDGPTAPGNAPKAAASLAPIDEPAPSPAQETPSPHGTQALAAGAHAGAPRLRPTEDLSRDEGRKPQAVMDFFEVESGDKVVELMAGRGYYVELLAQRVGPTGKVWAHNSPFVLERFAEAPIGERLARLDNPVLARLNTELDAPQLPGDLDAVLMILFFHDTYWQGVDRKAMLKAIHASLAPGGVFGLIDHHAEAGSRDRDVKKLHRVDRELVIEEVLAAGFVLEAESDLLRNPADDRSGNVFFAGESNRDQTDRFVLRFRRAP